MEDFVKYETAKLAEQKGFDWKTKYWYDQTETLNPVKGIRGSMSYEKVCYAPTQELLKKWLREVHNLHVTVDFYTHVEIKIPVWQVWISGLHNSFNGQTEIIRKRLDALINDVKWLEVLTEFNVFQSYETALETGLFKALNLIQ